jgi:4-hydroxy-4-methyl-2-oxoglutarate aldolase
MTNPVTIPDIPLLETSALADVMDEIGLPNQSVSPTLVSLGAPARFTGWATCVIYGAREGNAQVKSSDDFDLVDRLAQPGRVIVMGFDGPSQGAVLGGLMSREFRRRGAVGVVSNARIRDVDEIRQLGLPVYCVGMSPVNGARRLKVVSIGEPVMLPGERGWPVKVSPGDLMVADSDGVLVVPQRMATLVAEAALEVTRIEREIAAAIDSGVPRIEAMRARPRFAHIAPLRTLIAALSQ